MKARLLFVDSGKEWGGGTNSLLLLIQGLRNRGYQAEVAFHYDYSGSRGTVSGAFEQAGVPFHLVPHHLGRWHKMAREACRTFLAMTPGLRRRALTGLDRHWRIAPAARQIAALARQLGADMLIGNNQPSSNQEVLEAGRLARLPVVLHVRKTVPLQETEKILANAIARRIICVSESVRQHYLHQGLRADLCVTIPNGIDAETTHFLDRQAARRELGLPADSIVVGTVCSLLPLKCVDHLLRAIASLGPAQCETIRCVVVGDGPERDRLALLARSLGIDTRVRFAGFRPDAATLLQAFDIFALPSSQEGMPRSILEAMLAGLPVVAANVSGCRDIVVDGETGRLYPHGNIEQLSRWLCTLAADPVMRCQMGKKGQAMVLERYTLEAHIERVAAIIGEATA